MSLVTTTEMFKKANANGYAIGAFNINNLEVLQGIVDAAEENKSDVILQVSSGAMKYARPTYLRKMVEAAVEDSTIDIALHLDHGSSLQACIDAIDAGFTSVMIDASHHDLDENIKITKEVVEYAHARGIVVEAELGQLAGVEDEINVSAEDATYTVAAEAKRFVEETGVDSLAIAIGTSHGANKFKGEPKLAYDRLQEIMDLLPKGFPLVLHGASSVYTEVVQEANKYGADLQDASGVPDNMLSDACTNYNVCKINTDTDLRLEVTRACRKVFVESPKVFDPRKFLGPARDAVQAIVSHKIKNVLKSTNSAK